MSTSSSEQVLIIGAGLGGLALAQVLYDNNVPFELFKRDVQPASRKQGWAVALVESLPPFEELLPEETAKDLYTNSVNVHTGDNDEVGFANALNGEKVGAAGGVPHGQKGAILRVSREKLRGYLWDQNNLPVTSSKHFTRYEEDEQGDTAFFTDGTSVRGSLLIGADGAHSHVLDQLIGASHHRPALSRQVPIMGEVTLPPSLYEPIRKLGNAVVLTGAPGVRQQLGMLDMEVDMSRAYYFWALMLPRDRPEELSDWLQNASKEEIYKLATESVEHLHPTMKDLITFGGPEAIVQPPLKFIEHVSPEALPAGRVTVLGDAAHAMIPFRGAGANTAVLDACDLARLLIRSSQDGRDLASVLDEYYNIMLPRGRENVLLNRAAGNDSDNPAEDWAKIFQRK